MGRRRSVLLCALVLVTAGACAPSHPDPGGEGDDDDASGTDAALPTPDQDADAISDVDEGAAAAVDSDGDSTPDYQDSDSDGDGLSDQIEAGDDDPTTRPVDSDGDTRPDFRDDDSDANGLGDAADGSADPDGDGTGDFADLDDDGDHLRDVVELGPEPTLPRDTDGDAVPDHQDPDADGDTIADAHELATDPDADLLPAYRDLDADGDCRPDAVEAGDADLATAPIDTDLDGGGDFVDLDSDADGLLDALEDTDCDGAQGAGESSPLSSDSDGDGVSDLVESVAGTDANDPASNPQAEGNFVFLVPYVTTPTPAMDTLDFATEITQADVVFAMDTTGSMGEEIANLKTSLASTIIPGLIAGIPSVGIGVVDYEDFPTGDFGLAGDAPFVLLHRVVTVGMAGLAAVQVAVNQLQALSFEGKDIPESGWEALYQIATGAGVSVGGASVPAFVPAVGPPGVPPVGEQVGTIGGVGFRAGSLPIVVLITDAPSHNSAIFTTTYSNGDDGPYGFTGAASSASAIAALNAIGGKVIAVVSQGGLFAEARVDAQQGVTQTGAVVPTAAWGAVGAGRPAGCAASQCCTGVSGAGEASAGGNCPLVFTVDSAGAGLGGSIVQAIQVLTTFVGIDITATAVDDPGDGVDAVAAFVDEIRANPAGAAPCASGLVAVDTDGDGAADTFSNVLPGTRVCFDVVPKVNTTVLPTTMPQMFKATLVVTGDGVTVLDTRDVYFLVPPDIRAPPVD